METEEEVSPLPLADLVATLEQATLMAKELHGTTDPTRINVIHSTLHSAHHSLSLFLSHSSLHHPPLRPSLLFDPMLDDDVDNEIETVEERMRGVFIQNKRRRLSPGAEEEEEERKRGAAEGEVRRGKFDPLGTKVKGLDLVFQFHG